MPKRSPKALQPPTSLKPGYGLFLFLCIAGLLATILVLTGGYPSSFVKTVGYVCLALLAGIGFWVIGATDGQFAIPMLMDRSVEAKLGGGAAVGIIFMLVAHHITEVPPKHLTYEIPRDYKNRGLEVVRTSSPRLRIEALEDRWLLAHFDEDLGGGWFEATYQDFQGGTAQTIRFAVRRDGPPDNRLKPVEADAQTRLP